MTNDGTRQPAAMHQAMLDLDDEAQAHGALACAYCREQHGGWCVDEFWPSGPAGCPLAGLAPTVRVGHGGHVEPDAE